MTKWGPQRKEKHFIITTHLLTFEKGKNDGKECLQKSIVQVKIFIWIFLFYLFQVCNDVSTLFKQISPIIQKWLDLLSFQFLKKSVFFIPLFSKYPYLSFQLVTIIFNFERKNMKALIWILIASTAMCVIDEYYDYDHVLLSVNNILN